MSIRYVGRWMVLAKQFSFEDDRYRCTQCGRDSDEPRETCPLGCKDPKDPELAKAEARALAVVRNWMDVTGCLDGSYRWEAEGCVLDAVKIGFLVGKGEDTELEVEREIREEQEEIDGRG